MPTKPTQYSQAVYNSAGLPFNADFMEQTNPDLNGNYQTITYRQRGATGTIIAVVNLTFDANSNIVTYTLVQS